MCIQNLIGKEIEYCLAMIKQSNFDWNNYYSIFFYCIVFLKTYYNKLLRTKINRP